MALCGVHWAAQIAANREWSRRPRALSAPCAYRDLMRMAVAPACARSRCAVVEERAAVRNGLLTALRAFGHDVVGVSTIRELRLASVPVGAVVVDGARVGVPIDRLREHVLPELPDVRLLVVTDRIDDGVERGFEVVDRSLGAFGIARALSAPFAPGGGSQRETQSPERALTTAERGVLRLIAQGLTAREAGASLGISPRTVEKHKRTIFARLGASTQAQAVDLAIRAGELSDLEHAS